MRIAGCILFPKESISLVCFLVWMGDYIQIYSIDFLPAAFTFALEKYLENYCVGNRVMAPTLLEFALYLNSPTFRGYAFGIGTQGDTPTNYILMQELIPDIIGAHSIMK